MTMMPYGLEKDAIEKLSAKVVEYAEEMAKDTGESVASCVTPTMYNLAVFEKDIFMENADAGVVAESFGAGNEGLERAYREFCEDVREKAFDVLSEKQLKNISVTIGHDVRGGKTLERAEVVSTARSVLGLTDCTVTPCSGFYTHSDGTEVAEESTRLEFFAVEARVARDVVENRVPELARELGQESIAVQVSECDSTLVSASENAS